METQTSLILKSLYWDYEFYKARAEEKKAAGATPLDPMLNWLEGHISALTIAIETVKKFS